MRNGELSLELMRSRGEFVWFVFVFVFVSVGLRKEDPGCCYLYCLGWCGCCSILNVADRTITATLIVFSDNLITRSRSR